jgi:hypothetical protein
VNNSSNFITVAILYEGGKLAYCKNGDQSWTFMRYDVGCDTFDCWDIIYYKEQFYAVNIDRNIALCNFNGESPSVSKIIQVFPKRHNKEPLFMSYLVNSRDDKLLLDVRYRFPAYSLRLGNQLVVRPLDYFRTSGFDVFGMNWSGLKLKWDRMDDLEGERVSGCYFKKERVRGVRYRYSDGGETTEEGYSDGGIPSTDR